MSRAYHFLSRLCRININQYWQIGSLGDISVSFSRRIRQQIGILPTLLETPLHDEEQWQFTAEKRWKIYYQGDDVGIKSQSSLSL